MEKLDCLGWAGGFAFQAYGRRIGIRVTDAKLLAQLPERLPPGWTPSPSPIVERLYSIVVGDDGTRPGLRRFHLLYAGSARLQRTVSVSEVLAALGDDIDLYVAQASRRKLFLHAGVVGWQDRAILLPGRTFTGKSSLVAAFLRAGATYYSDEFAVLDDRGRVHPFPRPLRLREQAGKMTSCCSPETLGGMVGTRPLPVGLVAIVPYSPNAVWRPRQLSPGQGSLELLANTVAARQRPQAALRLLGTLSARVSIVKSRRREAAATVDHLVSGFLS